MEQLYHISGWHPTQEMSGAGFCVKLFPAWKEAIKKSGLASVNVDHMIKNYGREWLDGHGYPADIYEKPEWHFRITWGEWGPHHITIPGCNATGLDITDGYRAPENGRILTPHNVDTINQASMLLCIFLRIADYLIGKERG